MTERRLVADASAIVRQFAGTRVAVLGDVMLDEYVYGSVTRISPEAPVPILRADLSRRSYVLGGAANVARNLAELGARVALVGTIGRDTEGETVRVLLRASGVDDGGLVVDGSRPTTLKTRIIAQHQQVVRVDREDDSPLAEAVVESLLASMRDVAGTGISGVVVSDYSKGVLCGRVVEEARQVAHHHGAIVTANPKPAGALHYRDYDLVSMNRAELSAVARLTGSDGPDEPTTASVVRERCGFRRLSVTLGPDGIVLAAWGEPVTTVPAVPVDVFDVVGAGDTALSAMTLALIAGAAPFLTAFLGNLAGGAVVRKSGTAVVTCGEILELMESVFPRMPGSGSDLP